MFSNVSSCQVFKFILFEKATSIAAVETELVPSSPLPSPPLPSLPLPYQPLPSSPLTSHPLPPTPPLPLPLRPDLQWVYEKIGQLIERNKAIHRMGSSVARIVHLFIRRQREYKPHNMWLLICASSCNHRNRRHPDARFYDFPFYFLFLGINLHFCKKHARPKVNQNVKKLIKQLINLKTLKPRVLCSEIDRNQS